jgi:hypothetical protein
MKAALEKLPEASYPYIEFLLMHGKTVDGFSSWIRRKYSLTMILYWALFEYVGEWRLSVFRPSQLFRP